MYPVFCHYLSTSLYEESRSLLMDRKAPILKPPEISVIMAVHRPNVDLLAMAIRSALEQIGVATSLIISIDGEPSDHALVQDILTKLAPKGKRVRVLLSPQNEGVGRCRNRALTLCRTDYFTFLDCDDIFHPLRCLHAWLILESMSVMRVNTGYSRVSLVDGKIILLNSNLCQNGGNSFLAKTTLLGNYGYLAPLRFWEDTEYQTRLGSYGVSMLSATAVGHYQNTSCSHDYRSLATRWRQEVHLIQGHPYLCGTSWGVIDDETLAIRQHFLDLYSRLKIHELADEFPFC
jgi:glycosyltransferase involved in cell wall biosynthesis